MQILYHLLNVISRLLSSKSASPKVIIISSLHCMYIYVYIYIYTYTHTHIYIYTERAFFLAGAHQYAHWTRISAY
jgi:hypothetical protein